MLSEMGEALDALETPTGAEWEGAEGTVMASGVDTATGVDKAAVASEGGGSAVSTIDMAKDLIIENKEVGWVQYIHQ